MELPYDHDACYFQLPHLSNDDLYGQNLSSSPLRPSFLEDGPLSSHRAASFPPPALNLGDGAGGHSADFLHAQSFDDLSNELAIEGSEDLRQDSRVSGISRQSAFTPLSRVHSNESRQSFRDMGPGPVGLLPRRRSNYRRDPILGHAVSSTHDQSPRESVDPMQRWRQSPAEHEPVPLSAIAHALQDMPATGLVTRGPSKRGSSKRGSSASFRSGPSSPSSATSTMSLMSTNQQTRRLQSSRSHAARSTDNNKIFQCTFCCDTFSRKHDWARHEKSLHLNLDRWTCAPHGGSVLSSETGRHHCAYCNMLDPTMDHLELHNHSACLNNHSFSRKDHLVQHLRGFHQLQTLPILDDWQVQLPLVVSRCGFCDKRLASWAERTNHISKHFRQGLSMKDWKGDHCFEPSIASQIKNALPPYLLASEAKSVVPFSATDPRTVDHIAQIYQRHREDIPEEPDGKRPEPDLSEGAAPSFDLSATSYPKWLAFWLGRFAQTCIAQGVVPTDQMFQDESRRLVYGDQDAWEQTIADNEQWLSDFVKQHTFPR